MNKLLSLKIYLLALAVAAGMSFSGCKASNTAKGGAIGAGTGGAAGAVLGKKSGNTAEGAILGAAIGGVAGAAIGRYMDKQKREIEDELGKDAEVQRVGEGIEITFDSGILFGVDSSELQAEVKSNLAKLAATLKDYPDTQVLIEGHTDNTGTHSYNQNLSERRAASVRNYLTAMGVNNQRMVTVGYGETQPIADNSTKAGRTQNRRVHMAIYANDELKRKAERNQL